MAKYPVVGQHVVARSAGSAASITTAAITTITGSTFAVVVTCDGNHIGASAGVITDSKSNAYSTAVAGPGADHGAAMFYVANGTGGSSHTFTFTPTASDFITITVIELYDCITSPLGNTNTTRASSTTHSSGNVTTASESILIGGGATSQTAEGAGVITQGGRWVQISTISADSTHEGLVVGARAAANGITDQFTYVVSSAANETSIIAEFRGASTSSATESTFPFVGVY